MKVALIQCSKMRSMPRQSTRGSSFKTIFGHNCCLGPRLRRLPHGAFFSAFGSGLCFRECFCVAFSLRGVLCVCPVDLSDCSHHSLFITASCNGLQLRARVLRVRDPTTAFNTEILSRRFDLLFIPLIATG